MDSSRRSFALQQPSKLRQLSAERFQTSTSLQGPCVQASSRSYPPTSLAASAFVSLSSCFSMLTDAYNSSVDPLPRPS